MKKELYSNFLNIYDRLKINKNQDCFHTLTNALLLYYMDIWEECSIKSDFNFFNKYTEEQKLLNKNQTETFLDNFILKLQQLDKSKDNSSVKVELSKITFTYMNTSEFFNIKISEEYPNDFLKSTKFFIKNAVKFDRNFNFYDIFQALRNVWTMNLLQSINNINIKLTYPIFGYSMLYPYTDNLLDNKHITSEEKRFLSERLKRRLQGENLFPLSDYEDKVFELISLIEKVYPRNYHYSMYKSLLYIHLSQTQSLDQYNNNGTLDLETILCLSFKKGGISVLTDAYLVNGDLNLDEIIFSFGLGIVLQLIDDLQDIKSDYKFNNQTVFTYCNDKSQMDETTLKLINFILKVIDTVPEYNTNFIGNLKQALKQNCILMILFSISRSSSSYSKEFIRNIQKHYPFPASYMKNFNSQINSKCSKIKRMQNIKATDIFDILLTKE